MIECTIDGHKKYYGPEETRITDKIDELLDLIKTNYPEVTDHKVIVSIVRNGEQLPYTFRSV